MLESLRATFAGESLPFDESLARRLEIAKLIGLAFFYSSGRAPHSTAGADDDNYWQGWQMTREDRQASIMSVFRLATNILTDNVQVAVELATQAFILSGGHLPVAPAWAGEEYRRRIAERTTAIREADSRGGERRTEDLWPWKAAAASLSSSLRSLYEQMEPPIISKVTLPNLEVSGW